jgi:hypothetical protein
MVAQKKSLFVTEDGRNVAFTFTIVSSLFLLWGFCNGMIDVMDKHFQEQLHLTLSQSAWVQFAHYLGYFLMSLPAGWLANRVGYKGGIIAGLLMVALGGVWFIPATRIAAFWAFLLGVCVIAPGLTFLETVANPYTIVLGDKQYAATRINLAQSCNGVGWILGPIAGSLYFYSKDAAGNSTGAQTLYIPYVGVAAVVHVHHVPHDLCSWHFRPGRPRQAGFGFPCHGHRGRGDPAEGDGQDRRHVRHFARLHRADVLLRVYCLVCAQLAKVQQGRIDDGFQKRPAGSAGDRHQREPLGTL